MVVGILIVSIAYIWLPCVPCVVQIQQAVADTIRPQDLLAVPDEAPPCG